MEILSDIFPDGSTQYRRSTKFPSSSCSQYITYFSSAQSYIARKCFILKKNSRSSSFFSNFLFLSRNDDIPIERYSRYSGSLLSEVISPKPCNHHTLFSFQEDFYYIYQAMTQVFYLYTLHPLS